MAADLYIGDCLEVMRGMEENSIDAIVCDPPYGIGFMGKGWDVAVPGEDWARECLRVLKPGGHLIAFAATRTVHRLTVAVEDAGFEIRDQIGWLQWQGFPKSLDCSKAIDALHGAERSVVGQQRLTGTARRGADGSSHGAARTNAADFVARIETTINITAPATPDAKRFEGYGTALKPAFEPAVLARKPLSGTVAANCLEWGTGGLNIDGCRYAYGDPAWPGPNDRHAGYANGCGGAEFSVGVEKHANEEFSSAAWNMPELGRWPANIYACPKPSRAERERGCDHLPGKRREDVTGRKAGSAGQNHARSGMTRTGDIGNHHPTVQPIQLMRWLCKLVGGHRGNVILDPFMGSGTTGIAAVSEGIDFIRNEMSPDYMRICEARIRHAIGPLFAAGQITIHGGTNG